jgi:hypothetical protein
MNALNNIELDGRPVNLREVQTSPDTFCRQVYSMRYLLFWDRGPTEKAPRVEGEGKKKRSKKKAPGGGAAAVMTRRSFSSAT